MSNTDPPSRVPREQRHDTQAAREELSSKGKVEKVREIDADESRKKKFQKFYRPPPEPESAPKPSLFDLMGEEAKKIGRDLGFGENKTVPNNLPPSAAPLDGGSEEENANPLPRSGEFWEEVDFPPDQQRPAAPFTEVPELGEKKKKKVEASPFGPPGKVGKNGKKEPPARPAVMPHGKKQARREEEQAAPPLQSDEHARGRKRHHEALIIQSPSLHELPATVQPAAMAAATAAAGYIPSAVASLFYQMVGTMYVMGKTPGVSLTEIVLNNPAFASSKFFGATIKIAKYATAPDSFNITLSGSNAAVVSFKENIPSLMAAFQQGRFAFKVNRIDVQYSTERPIFRRKEKGQEKGDMGGDLREKKR